jgi:isopentenyl-diphosphate delta-isomerase
MNSASEKNYVTGSKLVTLVDGQDQVIGEMDIFAAHRYPCHRHRASSVWLINDQAKVLLQLRSARKPVGAGWWNNAVCGNVKPGESYEECAIRRLREEIGVTEAEVKPAYKFEYRAWGNQEFAEHEVDQVFVGRYNGQTEPNPDEATETIWLPWSELQRVCLAAEAFPSAQQSLELSWEELAQVTKPVVFEAAGRQLTLSPWSVMMARDERLAESLEKA